MGTVGRIRRSAAVWRKLFLAAGKQRTIGGRVLSARADERGSIPALAGVVAGFRQRDSGADEIATGNCIARAVH